MNIKGILVVGKDGNEYLLGWERTSAGGHTFTLSSRKNDGTFEPLSEEKASDVARERLGIRGVRPKGETDTRPTIAYRDAYNLLPRPD